MLEICFNDSVKGCLAYAQHCRTDMLGGTFGVITDKKGLFSFLAKRKVLKKYKKEQLALQKQAVSLGGNKEDIVGISFGLSEDDINSPICLDDCPRKNYIHSMFSFDRYNEKEDIEDAINTFWNSCIHDLEKLKANPEQIRVWVDKTPDAQCGLLFLADLLKDSNTEIHIVALPSQTTRADGCVVEYRGWGEVKPELYGTFLNNEKMLTKKEIFHLATKWQLLKNENSPLRVIENDLVVSADISYYDALIKKEFPKDTCKIAHIIGSALGKQKIPTGDIFIAKRIQEFIKSGELKIISNKNDRFYDIMVTCEK